MALGAGRSLSPRLNTEKHFLTVDRIGKKSFMKVPGDLKYKRVRKQLCTYVVFLCSAFVLTPVKQETLESTISLKEEQQQCVKIQIKNEIQPGRPTT